MKKKYLIRYMVPREKVVEAESPFSAAEFVRREQGELESVTPVGGGDDDRLIPIDYCAFCSRPRLANVDGVIGEPWHFVPDEAIDIPFGNDVACPHCAIEKGIVSQ